MLLLDLNETMSKLALAYDVPRYGHVSLNEDGNVMMGALVCGCRSKKERKAEEEHWRLTDT